MKKAKSREQIANEYGICVRTLRRWIQKKKLTIKNGLISPKEQELIYKTFGNPNELQTDKK